MFRFVSTSVHAIIYAYTANYKALASTVSSSGERIYSAWLAFSRLPGCINVGEISASSLDI